MKKLLIVMTGIILCSNLSLESHSNKEDLLTLGMATLTACISTGVTAIGIEACVNNKPVAQVLDEAVHMQPFATKQL